MKSDVSELTVNQLTQTIYNCFGGVVPRRVAYPAVEELARRVKDAEKRAKRLYEEAHPNAGRSDILS